MTADLGLGLQGGRCPGLLPRGYVEAIRHRPTDITYVNELPSFNDGGYVQGLLSVDQEVHWADPVETGCAMLENLFCDVPYSSWVPAVTHLHGAEVQSDFDGNPEQWFTNADDGRFGISYRSFQRRGNRSSLSITRDDNPTPGQAIYHYNNDQEATNLWFHDHALGVTRLHVYGGLAAFYLIRDGQDNGKVNNPIGLPGGPYEIEMMVQDRQFDTNGQWYFPGRQRARFERTSAQPSIFPFWIPEFLGRCHRGQRQDLALSGCGAAPLPPAIFKRLQRPIFQHVFRLLSRIGVPPEGFVQDGPRFWQIGTDGGHVNAPVETDNIFLAPAERADIIVDFSGLCRSNPDPGQQRQHPVPGRRPGGSLTPTARSCSSGWERKTLARQQLRPRYGGM